MAKQKNLKELYIDELKDLYDAENRLVKALPKLAKAAESEELRAAIEEHLEQTKGHVDRLREVFDGLEEKPTGKKCAAMVGLLEEAEEMLEEDYEDGVMDAAIISSAQRVEHYEMAAYGCVRTWAGLLGENDAQALLEKTLNEEKAADRKLTEVAEEINVEANQGEEEGEATEEESDSDVDEKPAKRLRVRRAGA